MSQSRTNSVQPSVIRGQLEKILAHKRFVRSERMARFLGFTVEQSLQGMGAELKEYLIGIEVFDRKDDYDPRIDPIVRVEARRLRGKLQAYYEADGQNDPVLIEFVSGTYAPRIRYRNEIPKIIPAALRSVAVLPFANLSRGAEDDYFSDGLTEELIHILTKFSGVRVMAWNSAVQMRGTEQDLPALRRHPQVSHIMTGSGLISGT